MGITRSTKELSVTTIPCGSTFSVTLALTAVPDIVSNPTDADLENLFEDLARNITQTRGNQCRY